MNRPKEGLEGVEWWKERRRKGTEREEQEKRKKRVRIERSWNIEEKLKKGKGTFTIELPALKTSNEWL